MTMRSVAGGLGLENICLCYVHSVFKIRGGCGQFKWTMIKILSCFR